MGTIKGSGTTIMTTIVIRNIKIGMLECHKCTALLVVSITKNVRRDRKKENRHKISLRNPSFTHPFIELGSKQALLPLDNDVGDCLHLRYRYRHQHHDL